jgi:hypothetical protein
MEGEIRTMRFKPGNFFPVNQQRKQTRALPCWLKPCSPHKPDSSNKYKEQTYAVVGMTWKITNGAVQLQPQPEVLLLVRVIHTEARAVELVQLIHKALGVDLAILDLAANVCRSTL